jgi:hypothetical protein
MKFPRKAVFVWVITVYLSKWLAVPGLMAEERTSVAPVRPLTADPREMSDKVELISAE